ncbi:spindle pole body component alp14 [Colletotrichum graminicola M1.001]|uniref:Spindle pole body component alp14 n=1 Tax=Colletotrichum graminicola (strain M1.001 / M2 / FGSC 10212) TaxID=645133 RepID=E3QQF2_COLGM|nr:spindle pole body component alp14 [Colletotrichum graminicola M1.001]EFQ33090.1 spindle pole body component alp14 [Colletotrichum graminicola M1.001]
MGYHLKHSRSFSKLIRRVASFSKKPATRDEDKFPSDSPLALPPTSCSLRTKSEPLQPQQKHSILMAEEEDFSSIPLQDRFAHKVWKVRKGAYEEAAKAFAATADEYDNAFRPFISDSGIWKGAVADSNVAAQQEGLAAYCAFLKFGGKEHCTRTRGVTIGPICEKGLPSTRAAAKESSLEALLLLVELDVAGPVIEEIIPALSNKQPKVVAAAITALTAIYHSYGCKTVDPKPVLKALPKAFGHADKNVRAAATNLAVEFYRWLREAMKPMFWGDLKPTQQTDLEAQFEKIKSEPAPKQERFLRSQQAAMARAPPPGAEGEEEDDGDYGEEPAEVDAFDLAEPQDVLGKVPANFSEALASSKWKERKEAVEGLYAAINVPRIKDGDFNEINRGLAKCMKDANVAVVTQAAQCIEVLAKGLRSGYAKHRATVMQPIMDRLKEKKASVADALGAALDQVFLATSLTDCLEDINTYLVHKNPQVKEGTMKFLIRCLRTTRDVPSKPEIASIVESGKKLLSESSEGLRSGGAEILGTVMKIIGERAMGPHMEGLDDIRKTKIKEFFETAQVKAKEKPKAPPPAAKAPPPKKLVGGKKPAMKKPVMPAAAAPPPDDFEPPSPQASSRSKPAGTKMGMPKPSGLAGLKSKRPLGAPSAASPRRPAAAPIMPEDDPAPPPPQPRIGLGRGGLAGRSLAKPAAAPVQMPPASPPPSDGLTAMERAELEELRAANERLARQVEEMRHERSKYMSEIQELKNQNAGLIEDHTRDVLSIKAKETQLVRARSDAEATEQTNDRLRRELDRLKRALNHAEGLNSRSGMASPGLTSPTYDDVGIYRDASFGSSSARHNRVSYASNMSEEKENGDHYYPRSKALSPELRYTGSASSGRGSPARGYRSNVATPVDDMPPPSYPSGGGNGMTSNNHNSNGVESWKRAAEVTSQLKARIEQMKAKQGFARP